MLVTLMADASFCPETGCAGYGYWIASQRGKDGGSGAMKDLCDTSSTAEMKAIANALFLASQKGLVCLNDRVLIQTDCEAAIDAFKGIRTRLTKQEQETKQYLIELKVKLDLVLEFRHVKGHSKRQEARFRSNNMCDKQAYAAMREARQRHLNRKKADAI